MSRSEHLIPILMPKEIATPDGSTIVCRTRCGRRKGDGSSCVVSDPVQG